MARLLIFTLLLVVLASIGHSAPTETQVEAKVTFVKDVSSLLRANPELKASPMNRGLERGQIRYTVGSRINGKFSS